MLAVELTPYKDFTIFAALCHFILLLLSAWPVFILLPCLDLPASALCFFSLLLEGTYTVVPASCIGLFNGARQGVWAGVTALSEGDGEPEVEMVHLDTNCWSWLQDFFSSLLDKKVAPCKTIWRTLQGKKPGSQPSYLENSKNIEIPTNLVSRYVLNWDSMVRQWQVDCEYF